MKPDGENREKSIYETSFNKTAALLRSSDLDKICRICGTRLEGTSILVPFFNEEYTIKLPEVVFHPPTLSIYGHILILHYLTTLGTNSTKGEYVIIGVLSADVVATIYYEN